MFPITGRTRVIGIIGDPVAQSRSPAMHNAALQALKLDAVYVPFHVTPARLRDAVRAIRAFDLLGLNVTVPHKERILPLLDGATRRAKLIGAVNTVYRHGDELVGDNTDATGFLRALLDVAFRVRGTSTLVVGAGGAARAVVAALHEAGAKTVHVVNRSPARRRSLAAHFARSKVAVETGGLEDLTDANVLRRVRLIVNTTSVGWRGEPFPPLRFETTDSRCLFHDLVYGEATDFLARARRAGRPTLDGLSMLLHQGAAAFSLWTGRNAPLDVMSRALRQHTVSRSTAVLRDKS